MSRRAADGKRARSALRLLDFESGYIISRKDNFVFHV
jgi:hypothetical protein